MKAKRCTACGQRPREASPVEKTVLGVQSPGTAPLLENAWGVLLDVVGERGPVSVLDVAPMVAMRSGCSIKTAENLAYTGVKLGRLNSEYHRRRASGRSALHLMLPRESD